MPIRCAARYGESGDGARECHRGVRGAAEGHPLHSSLPGIRLPEVAVLVGTHAGWDPRDPATGAPEQIVPMNGLTLFFAADAGARKRTRDPRPSLASADDYTAKVRTAAQALVAER